MKFLHRLPLRIAHAHCDIPCGIYDPRGAQTAAKTVRRMVELIIDPPFKVEEENHDYTTRQYHNAMTRYVLVKEQHAQLCKQELFTLWADYFKDEHLKMFPDLHEKMWRAVKLCSKNKQAVDMKLADELTQAVDQIADMFNHAEAAKKK